MTRTCSAVAAVELALVGDWALAVLVVAFGIAWRAGDLLLPRWDARP